LASHYPSKIHGRVRCAWRGFGSCPGYGYWALAIKCRARWQAALGKPIPPHDRTQYCGQAKIWLGPGQFIPWQRLSTEAVAAIQAWGDEELESDETSCIIATTNAPSIHLAHKIGFKTVAEGSYKEVPHLVLLRHRA
jgi:RimJ/RimL family protein N-acetyltransferase